MKEIGRNKKGRKERKRSRLDDEEMRTRIRWDKILFVIKSQTF